MTDSPTIMIESADTPLSDAAIRALATLLVDVVEREHETKNASPAMEPSEA